MRGLNSPNGGSNRSKSTCSFCASPDHQASKCPHIVPIKKSLDKGIVPLKYLASISANKDTGQAGYWRSTSYRMSYLSKGENWGELYKQTEKAFEKWERAQARAKNKAKRGKAKKVCGYCGGDHTRRTCGLLASHKTKLAKANRNFRKWFYEEYVQKQGLSTGAIVDIECFEEGGYRQPSQTTTVRTLVTEINWDTINLFADFTAPKLNWSSMVNYNGKGGLEKLQNIQRFVRSGAYLKVAKSTFESKGVDCGSGGWRTQHQHFRAVPLPLMGDAKIASWIEKDEYYNAAQIKDVSIVSRAPQVLADDWVDGYSDEMSVIFKKFDRAQLEFTGILDHINDWANKE